MTDWIEVIVPAGAADVDDIAALIAAEVPAAAAGTEQRGDEVVFWVSRDAAAAALLERLGDADLVARRAPGLLGQVQGQAELAREHAGGADVVAVLVGDQHGRGAVDGLGLGEHAGVDDDHRPLVLESHTGMAELGDPHAPDTNQAVRWCT